MQLMEEAVRILGEIPEGQCVYVTSANTVNLYEMERDFKEAGLVDVVFMDVRRIMNGELRGRKGRLLIDAFYDLTFKEQEVLIVERDILRYL